MVPLPPIPPPHLIIRHADASVVVTLQAHAQTMTGPAALQQQFRQQQDHLLQQARTRREREMVARLRSRTTTSQRA